METPRERHPRQSSTGAPEAPVRAGVGGGEGRASSSPGARAASPVDLSGVAQSSDRKAPTATTGAAGGVHIPPLPISIAACGPGVGGGGGGGGGGGVAEESKHAKSSSTKSGGGAGGMRGLFRRRGGGGGGGSARSSRNASEDEAEDDGHQHGHGHGASERV
jgi:hypothetical protein